MNLLFAINGEMCIRDRLTLEEIFIYELGGADYAVKDILL